MGDTVFGIFFSFLVLFFGFKLKQNRGRLYLNDLLTSIGGGSFLTIIKGYFFDLIYLILCIGCGWGAFVFLSKAGIIK